MLKIKNIIAIASASLFLLSCSKIANTVNGLSTFQSTIAGSNYPFTVDKNGNLSPAYEPVSAEKLIGNGEHFSITLDSLFLRYLQASDPYIVVYSEAWMGSEIRPNDDKLLQRQILLLKDGVGFNSRLPINWVPLLGPVTMEQDSMDVYISLNVVVLSKNDNKQTTDLLDGLASVSGTVAPQYALIAGAAAGIGKAIVAQNRDKVEFEHTFNLSPRTDLKSVFNIYDATGEIEPPLAESKLVIIKGENEHRLVPYENWFYYIWPFNWIGHKPNNNTLRFESAHQHYKHFKKDTMNLIDEGATYSLVNIPFKILSELLIPNDSYLLQKETTSPDQLTLKGGYLIRNSDNDTIHDKFETTFIHRLYSEKTHAILSIKRTAGSYGNFNQLKDKFSSHGDQINTLLADTSSSEKAITDAFDAIKRAVIYDRNKNKITQLAKSSVIGQDAVENVLKLSNDEDKKALIDIFWKELSIQSGKRLKSSLDNIIAYLDKPLDAQAFYTEFSKVLEHEKANYWNLCKPEIEADRNIYWIGVIQTVSDYLFSMEKTKIYSQKITENFGELKNLDACG